MEGFFLKKLPPNFMRLLIFHRGGLGREFLNIIWYGLTIDQQRTEPLPLNGKQLNPSGGYEPFRTLFSLSTLHYLTSIFPTIKSFVKILTIVKLSHSHLFPGSGVVLDCIDS